MPIDSFYNSNLNDPSFSLFNPAPLPENNAGKRESSSTAAQSPFGASLGAADAPNVVGLSRLVAINTLIADGFDYLLSYTTSGATSGNNDIVSAQTTTDNIVSLSVYQYVAPVSVKAGYFAGGLSDDLSNIVDKFAFSNDSRTTLGTGLSSVRFGLAGMANSGTAGYFGGGYTAGYVTTVDKFAFSNDSRTTLETGLSVARTGLAGFANSNNL